ncbi:hypothetical protein GF337_16505 [candidate division KSB1 bacterium]|nr:hypothetical protein [candidate division KSB1 bacterium]
MKSIQSNEIQGVLIKRKYHVSSMKRILATMVIAFVIAYYFAMKDFGDALS